MHKVSKGVAALMSLALCAALPLQQSASGARLDRGIAKADSLVKASIGKLTPGAVLLIAKDGKVVHEKAYGYATLNDYDLKPVSMPRPLTTSTMFDLASVTKVMATTLAMMMLADQGKVDLDAPVYRYLPDFRGPHLDSITVKHLLQHSSGLVQWQPLYYQASNSAETYRAIREMPLGWGVGEGRHYSDLGFMLLGYIVEKVSGERLDRYMHQSLYRPLGLTRTMFRPKDNKNLTDFAATEQGNVYEKHMVYDTTFGYDYKGDPKSWDKWRTYVLYGEVDDGNAYYANEGVAGHAGLFATASDLRVLLDILVNRGTYNGRRYVSRETIGRFLTLDKYGHYLGWQLPPEMPQGSFMHTGFTGTYVLGVPKHGLSIVLLTNRQNLGTDSRGFFPDVGPLRLAVAKAIVSALEAPAGPHFEAADFSAGRWLKGNTHTHTLESDGDSPPDSVALWYKRHGYNFLVLSDHNVFVDPARFASLTDSGFLLIPGEEVTTRFQQKPVHVNGLNIPGVIAPQTDSTLLGTVQKNVDAVRKVNGVPHINHPNFGWAISQDVLWKVNNDKLVEIHNGHPLVHNEGGGESPGMEMVWDYLLSKGKRIYGIATDDAHHFKGEFAPDRANPGRGWVTVRASRLDAREIMTALEAGRFYASSGVELDSLSVGARDMTVAIRKRGDFRYTTEFIGKDGTVLKRTGANPATYHMKGTETYVRARVTDSMGAKAWIQPVFITR